MRLIASALVVLSTLTSAASSSKSITIYSWPLSASKPGQLAQVSYDSTALTSTISKYTPPTGSYTPEERIRVGFYDPQDGKWAGVVTSAASFDPTLQQKLSIQVDDQGEMYHISFGAVQKTKATEQVAKGSGKNGSAKREAKATTKPLIVELVKADSAPRPVLNKPVVLDPTGKVAGKVEEKSFLQKYWWAIAALCRVPHLRCIHHDAALAWHTAPEECPRNTPYAASNQDCKVNPCRRVQDSHDKSLATVTDSLIRRLPFVPPHRLGTRLPMNVSEYVQSWPYPPNLLQEPFATKSRWEIQVPAWRRNLSSSSQPVCAALADPAYGETICRSSGIGQIASVDEEVAFRNRFLLGVRVADAHDANRVSGMSWPWPGSEVQEKGVYGSREEGERGREEGPKE
ncbi:hypothetical protein FH972_022087 [Carpinus fangiana]|uniref:Uncharacterized protein n=1 Tax=Carpinus fangiana TaxID=176857 RepID=A0A5N6KTE9_9ROSI|nr:hypothetical protein FH972_022087 [Carpinus fangiana]